MNTAIKQKNRPNLANLRVALVHDFLREYGGAERVLEEFHSIFPQADVYTALLDSKRLGIAWQRMKDWNIYTSWYGKIPFLRDYPSLFRFITPSIWESFNFSSYDLIISSSGWYMSKGIITRADSFHISYIHHQNKFLTFYETPDDWQKNTLKQIYANIVGPYLRLWDYVGAQRPDVIVTNSYETQKRIQKYYRRDSIVIYPPIRDPAINLKEKQNQTDDYYITVSRLAKPKHVDVLIHAANKLGIELYVVGTGKEEQKLRRIANKNIKFTGHISDLELNNLLFRAKCFLFASVDEEFGIAPVEALMFGVPVIAYKSGGLKETVVHGFNGYHVDELNSSAFCSAIQSFEKGDLLKFSKNAYTSAKKFSQESFRKQFLEVVNKAISKHTIVR